MRALLRLPLYALLFLVSATAASTPAKAAEITVSAAASLTEAFTALSEEFTAESGIMVRLNFASSNSLLRQMQNGAPVDVFASADQDTMDKAELAGLTDPASRHDFAGNSLLLVSPAGRRPLSLDALTESGVERIALGSPSSVPAGRYARESLRSAGLWEKLQDKLIFGSSVRQVLAYVQRGEVDAGIVYATDLPPAAGKVRADTELGGHSPIRYPMAVTTLSTSPEEARLFLEYVLSRKGQGILSRFGFLKAD